MEIGFDSKRDNGWYAQPLLLLVLMLLVLVLLVLVLLVLAKKYIEKLSITEVTFNGRVSKIVFLTSYYIK